MRETTLTRHRCQPPFLADGPQLEQVVVNLLMNAFEACDAGDAVRVRAEARARDDEPGIAVLVEDEGGGIPADVVARVFEPFFTTKPPGQGTGLGLAIARDIVRDHGGDIAVESRPGEGTTFTVWLPAAGAPRPAGAPA